jgi:hypothetical protein
MQKFLSLCKSLTQGPALGRRKGAFNSEAFDKTAAMYQKTFGAPLPVALWRSRRSPTQTPAQAPVGGGRKTSETPETYHGASPLQDGASPPQRLQRDLYELPAEEPSAPVAAQPAAHVPPAPSHGVKRESAGDAPASKKVKAPTTRRSSFRIADWLRLKLCSAPNGCINGVTLLQTLKAELPDVAKLYKSDRAFYAAIANSNLRDPVGSALVTHNTTNHEFTLTDVGRAYAATLNGPAAAPPARTPSTQFSLMLYSRPDLTALRLRVNVRPDTTLEKVIRAVSRSLDCEESAMALALGGQVLTDLTASCGHLGLTPDNNKLHLMTT